MYSDESYDKVEALENALDRYEDKLGSYLMQLAGKWMTRQQSREVTQYTRGKGSLRTAFHGYAPCHNADAVIAEIPYDPDVMMAGLKGEPLICELPEVQTVMEKLAEC